MPDEHRSPDWTIDLRSRLTDLRVADTRIDDIVEELSQHLDDCYDELVESGVPDGVARRPVLDELAAPHVLRRALAPLAVPVPAAAPVLGQVHTGSWLAGLTTDVRDGIRALRGSPAMTIVALLTLAIGIGASVAIFSVVNAAILRPLPFARPNEIVSFWGSAPEMGLPVVNYPDAVYDYFRKRSYTMQPIAAYTSGTLTLSGTGEPERLRGAFVTAEFFRLFGRAPQIGRDFLPEEEARHRNRVAVISDGLWRRRFGARPDVIGQSLTLDGLSITVIGVMARGFDFPDRAEMWLPIPTDPQATSCWCYGTIGRLTAGQTSGSAAREIAWLTDDFWRERDKKPVEDRTSGNPKAIVVASPLARELTGDVRTPLFVLMGAVGLVLLIACANIANLLLARAGARTREIAMRCCLGASMWRIVRQLLVESLLLGIAGAALGMIVAVWGAQALGRLIVERLPHVNNVPLDPAVLLFALGVTLITVVLFGVAPAVRGARVDLQTAVKDGVRSSRGAASRRLTNAFVVAQLALSIVLLVGAVLLLRSLGNLLAIDPGFRSDNVLVGRVTLALNDRPEAEANQYVRAFYAQLADRLRALPGVSHVGLSSTAPFSAGNNQQIFSLKGHEPAPGQPKLVASVRGVTPGYFAAIGTPLQLGRLLDASDTERAPLVALVDETLARRFWPDGNAVGQEVRLGDDGPWRRIVGVVASVKHGDLSHDSDRYVYLPHAQYANGADGHRRARARRANVVDSVDPARSARDECRDAALRRPHARRSGGRVTGRAAADQRFTAGICHCCARPGGSRCLRRDGARRRPARARVRHSPRTRRDNEEMSYRSSSDKACGSSSPASCSDSRRRSP